MSMAYAGRVPGCGCLVAACIDTPDDPKRVAKWVADFIKDGLEVERVDSEVVRLQMQRCPHEDDGDQGNLFAEAVPTNSSAIEGGEE